MVPDAQVVSGALDALRLAEVTSSVRYDPAALMLMQARKAFDMHGEEPCPWLVSHS